MKFIPKKSLGQNFLVDNNILNIITNLGQISSNDIVLEVGPGTGNLTKKILEKKPKKLIIIEKDRNLSKILKEKFNNDVEIINDDILNYNHEIIKNKKIIIFGNLPYNISTQILTSWIKIKSLKDFCKIFVLMFQKEVADRIIAKHNSKNYGRLSIISSWKMEIQKIIDINPASFNPSPKIKSSLLVFKPKTNYFKLGNSKNLEHITNIFFNQRRKMIKKPLKFLFNNHEKIAEELSLDLNEPYIDLVLISQNSTFIAKKAKTFNEEKKVAEKAPVDGIKIDNLGEDKEQSKEVIKDNFFEYSIKIADFYYKDSAKNMSNRIINETKIKDPIIIELSKTKYRVLLGPFNDIKKLEESFNEIKSLNFENLEILKDV